MCLSTGSPGDVELNITTTAYSFTVQWSDASSHSACGLVWYVVITSTEGGIMIDTHNTTMTSHNVTGLNDSTVYYVSLTASNEAGSGNAVTETVTINST